MRESRVKQRKNRRERLGQLNRDEKGVGIKETIRRGRKRVQEGMNEGAGAALTTVDAKCDAGYDRDSMLSSVWSSS